LGLLHSFVVRNDTKVVIASFCFLETKQSQDENIIKLWVGKCSVFTTHHSDKSECSTGPSPEASGEGRNIFLQIQFIAFFTKKNGKNNAK
jgi:hypothetical protein